MSRNFQLARQSKNKCLEAQHAKLVLLPAGAWYMPKGTATMALLQYIGSLPDSDQLQNQAFLLRQRCRLDWNEPNPELKLLAKLARLDASHNPKRMFFSSLTCVIAIARVPFRSNTAPVACTSGEPPPTPLGRFRCPESGSCRASGALSES